MPDINKLIPSAYNFSFMPGNAYAISYMDFVGTTDEGAG